MRLVREAHPLQARERQAADPSGTGCGTSERDLDSGVVAMRGAQILLVDDDPVFLQALPETLRLRLGNLTIETCETARSAVRRFHENEYDLIICDVKMPVLDGFALLEKAKPVRPLTPVILITGHGEPSLIGRGLALGAYDVLQKPVDRDALILAVKRALEVRSLRRYLAAHQKIMGQLMQRLARLEQRWRRWVETQTRLRTLLSPSERNLVRDQTQRIVQLLRESYRRRLQCDEELRQWSVAPPMDAAEHAWLTRQARILKGYEQHLMTS